MGADGTTSDLRTYAYVTAAYWADTITDGAVRVLVLFYFYQLGYSPLQVASLFLFYEIFGVITNLFGGWIAARWGLKSTLVGGLSLQIGALLMLGLAPAAWFVVPYVMVSQAVSGVAKDLTKMSSKSAVKMIVPSGASDVLFKWVAVLTGSKNALKGVGFFLGGLMLSTIGFRPALIILSVFVGVALIMVLVAVHGSLGQGSTKARFTQMFSNTRAVNLLSAARVFLFASRDVWFVVGLPVYLRSVLGWTFWEVGGFMAIWVIGYGIVQSASPRLLKRRSGHVPTGRTAALLAFGLAILPAGIAVALSLDFDPATVLVVGLVIFGVVFALNSAVHSFLILHYADGDKVAMNVGFYYMANAFGRLAGTILSGLLYEWQGLEACLWASAIMVVAAGLISLALPGSPRHAIPVAAPTS
ncbi:MAG: organoarsenical effux MFS transporter ArsJ [Miltoncostaeaceae bacterium]